MILENGRPHIQRTTHIQRTKEMKKIIALLLLVSTTSLASPAIDWHWQNAVLKEDRFRVYIKNTGSNDQNPNHVLCARTSSSGISYIFSVSEDHQLSEHNGKSCVLSDNARSFTLTTYYLYADNPSLCDFHITGSPRGIGHSRRLHQLTSGVVVKAGSVRSAIKKKGKQGQLSLDPDRQYFLEGYFSKKRFKSGVVEVDLSLHSSGRRGAEAVVDLKGKTPIQCQTSPSVIILKDKTGK